MNSFNAKVVTPEGEKYNGAPVKVTLRTLTGEIGILARHTDYVGAVDTCIVRITEENALVSAVCSGGFLTVDKGELTLICNTFETADKIDRGALGARLLQLEERIGLCSDEREKKILKAEQKRLKLKEQIINE